jgi:DNA recombination protein RmuC
MEIALGGFGILILIALVAVIVLQLRKPRVPAENPLTLIQNEVKAVQERLDNFGVTVSNTLQQSAQETNKRLDAATEVFGALREKIGEIHESGKAAAELVNIMRAPKLRGGIGEFLLGDLLAQILPAEHFRLQYRFKSGVTVDAAIQIGPKVVPVDSKFPLENFRRILEAPTEHERAVGRKQFLRDVKKHIDAIASKYILPDEGTYPFALMYVPAENVYYETIIREESASEERQVLPYALEKRVIPVSPNSFYAYLQVIVLGLKGMKVEENAQEILNMLNRLRGDFERLQESFRLLGRHLTNAQNSYADTDKTLTKFEAKLAQIEAPAEARALPSI